MRDFRSERLGSLEMSPIRAMTKECHRLGGINMGQGVCDMPTPPLVRDGAIEAIQQRESRYSYAEGAEQLRRAISEKLKRDNNIEADPLTEIVVTSGSAGAFACSMIGLLNPGDGLLIFEPYYGYHVNCAKISGIEPQFVTLQEPDFQIKEEDIRKAIKPNTKAMVICTPVNPSGKMFSQSELEIIDKVAEEYDLLVISDEIYEYITYDDRKHISPASVGNLRDRCVTIMGVSKTFSITGWRLGYAACKPEIAKIITLTNDIYYICAPTPLQLGAAKGFESPPSFFEDLKAQYSQKRELFCSALKEAGLNPIIPQGSYYVLADINHLGFNSAMDGAMEILKQCKVASVPGTAFYEGNKGERFLRFCFALEDDILREASQRIASFKR